MNPPAAKLRDPLTPVAPADAVRALTRAVWVAAALCALGVLTLLGVYWFTRHDDPLQSPQLAALKQQLVAEPANEALKEEIRALDLRLRRRHAWQLAVHQYGAWFLLGSAGALVALGRWLARLQVAAPLPRVRSDTLERAEDHARRARRLTTAVAALTVLTAAWLGGTARSTLPADPSAMDTLLARHHGREDPGDMPSPAEYAANWPRFLGPTGNAHVPGLTLPQQFDLTGGAGLRWRTPLEVPGFNSPLIWGQRVFLSGGDKSQRQVLAFDLENGRRLWSRPVINVPGSPAQPPEVPEMTGFAAATMATDGRRVYAFFANGDLAAFSLEGDPVWSRNLGVPRNPYGHATSLVTWQDRLLVQLDQGDADQNLSRLYALEGATGRVLWQKNRPVGASWATPVVFEAAGKPQIGTLGGDFVIAYDARDGTELWRARLLSGEVTPSPLFVNGLFLGVSPSDRLFALRPDGAGDVTRSYLVWETDEWVPDITSPASNGDLVFTVLTHGVVAAYNLTDGKLVWEHELGFDVHASPAIAGERLYVFGTKGSVAVLEAGRTPRELARFDLGEEVHASPALARGVMVVRTVNTLFCVAAESPSRLEAWQP